VLSIGANDTFVITDWSIQYFTQSTVTIFCGADATIDASERLHVQYGSTNVGQAISTQTLNTPAVCQTGTYPKLRTGQTGAVASTIHGFVIRNR
jgi:hypothetical protein